MSLKERHYSFRIWFWNYYQVFVRALLILFESLQGNVKSWSARFCTVHDTGMKAVSGEMWDMTSSVPLCHFGGNPDMMWVSSINHLKLYGFLIFPERDVAVQRIYYNIFNVFQNDRSRGWGFPAPIGEILNLFITNQLMKHYEVPALHVFMCRHLPLNQGDV